jgi:hypothetical protein
VLREFTEKQSIPYPLLSDVDSEVIDLYRIRNTQVQGGDAFLDGIPFPGVYVTDADGVVVAKFFHDSYKKRDSPELYIDAALGRATLAENAPSEAGGDDDVQLTVALHGGRGTIRQGIRRHVVVRFELGEGLHVYGEPVPEGMIPSSVTVTGPPGLVVEDPILPPTTPLRLESMGVELQVWSGTVDLAVPVYAVGELASETRPLDTDTIEIEVAVRYQACTDDTCLLPRTETFTLSVPLDVVDIPAIALHQGHGQREGAYDGTPHLRRLFLRKVKASPLGFLRFVGKSIRLELAARKRKRGG